MDEKPGIPLDYAPRPRRRGKAIWRGIAAGTLVFLIIAGWHWGPRYWPGIWRQAQIDYWRHECMVHQPPPDFVVYDQDPSGPSPYIKKGGEYESDTAFGYFAGHRKELAVAEYKPNCLWR